MKTPESHSKLWISVEELIALGNRVSKSINKRSTRVHTQLMGNHASIFKGRGLDFEEVRQYAKGDDVRLIDWKVTARTKKPHTRVYAEEKERPTYIIADQCADMCFASNGTLKTTQVAELAALIAFTTLKRGDRVGGSIITDEEVKYLKPVRSKKHVIHWCAMLSMQSREVLAIKHIVSQIHLLEQALNGLLGLAYHDANLFVVTTMSKISNKVKEQLIRLAQHNQVTVINIQDPLDELNIPVALPVTDGEYQVLRTSSTPLKQPNFSRELAEMNIGTINITTIESTSSQVLNWFKQQRAR